MNHKVQLGSFTFFLNCTQKVLNYAFGYFVNPVDSFKK